MWTDSNVYSLPEFSKITSLRNSLTISGQKANNQTPNTKNVPLKFLTQKSVGWLWNVNYDQAQKIDTKLPNIYQHYMHSQQW